MRRGIAVVAVLVVILAGIGIGVGAYKAGERNGIAQGIEQVQVAQDQRAGSPGRPRGGRGPPFFFPGFFLFPLFLFGTFFLIGGDHARARGAGVGGPEHGPGPWNDEGRRRFEERAREWHQHEHGEPPAAATPQADETRARGGGSGCLRPVRARGSQPTWQRILVVEDEMQIARNLRDYLEVAGFEVTVVGDGCAALASARGDRPDLVVLDLGLPGIDGLDVARELRARRPTCRS